MQLSLLISLLGVAVLSMASSGPSDNTPDPSPPHHQIDPASSTSPSISGPTDEPQTNPQDWVAQLRQEDDGLIHLADDGVLRSYAANGTVLDARQLDNAQIMAFIKDRERHPNMTPSILQHFHDVFQGVSGFDVTDPDHLLNPPAELRPPRLSNRQVSPPQSRHVAGEILSTFRHYRKRAPPLCNEATCNSKSDCTRLGCDNSCPIIVVDFSSLGWGYCSGGYQDLFAIIPSVPIRRGRG